MPIMHPSQKKSRDLAVARRIAHNTSCETHAFDIPTDSSITTRIISMYPNRAEATVHQVAT
jgi:hypothetical protein